MTAVQAAQVQGPIKTEKPSYLDTVKGMLTGFAAKQSKSYYDDISRSVNNITNDLKSKSDSLIQRSIEDVSRKKLEELYRKSPRTR